MRWDGREQVDGFDALARHLEVAHSSLPVKSTARDDHEEFLSGAVPMLFHGDAGQEMLMLVRLPFRCGNKLGGADVRVDDHPQPEATHCRGRYER